MAVAVGAALERAGIRAVLTGGACAVIHSAGDYVSEDLDLIIQSAATQGALDDAMASIGFRRAVDHYVHSESRFFVEFPRGPLSIGRDVGIRPVRIRIGPSAIAALSPTDSCRDRLAAFYHWNDRQGLAAAVAIAVRNRVDLRRIRSWSEGENAATRFEEFVLELRQARRRLQTARRPTRSQRTRQAPSRRPSR